MPIETPHGISSRVPPSSFASGTFFCFASASQNAVSSAAFAMLWPRTRCEQIPYFRRGADFPVPAAWTRCVAQNVPRGFNRFVAIIWIFAGSGFAPARDSVDLRFDEHDAAQIGLAEAGLKRRDQPQMNFAKRDFCADCILVKLLSVLREREATNRRLRSQAREYNPWSRPTVRLR